MNSTSNWQGKLQQALFNNKLVQLAELIAPFVLATIIIVIAKPFVEDKLVLYQIVVWLTNVLVLIMIWLGLRLRGQSWRHFGFSFQLADRRTIIRTILQSIVVFVIAVAAFIIGAIIMANIAGIPQGADMSGYDFLKGNLPGLILVLIGVFIVSSFGEEVIYRAFLINRIAELGGGNKWAWRIAVVISSIIFGLVHFSWGVTGVVQTGFMGLALALSYLFVKRKLWVVILAHAYMDAILMIQMY